MDFEYHIVSHSENTACTYLEVDDGLAGSLDRDGEAAVARLPRPHVEVGRLALHPTLQPRTAGVDLGREIIPSCHLIKH